MVKHAKWSKILFALFLVSSYPLVAGAETQMAEEENIEEEVDAYELSDLVVVGAKVVAPLVVETRPQETRHQMPSADGAGFLKEIPGFSMVRKGGTGGDPLLRGMGGSRLNILVNGGCILGGCGGRMDPTTTYIFPEAFSKITVIKGPESVKYGGGNVAGTVLFEQKTKKFLKKGSRFNSSLAVGAFNRLDEFLDYTTGDKNGYVRILQTKNKSDDYRAGNGSKVHSAYGRDSVTAIFGYKPSRKLLYEFSYGKSTGHALYADRWMDGREFNRDTFNFRYERNYLTRKIELIRFNLSRTYIDHLMNNYSYRPLPNNDPRRKNESRVRRMLTTGRGEVDFHVSKRERGAVGFDFQHNVHDRKSVFAGRWGKPDRDFIKDMTFMNYGLFFEYNYQLSQWQRILSGMRLDRLHVDYNGRHEDDTTYSKGAFIRYEKDYVKMPVTFFFGLGHAERPADWWERNRMHGMELDSEKSTQFDLGWVYGSGRSKSALSLFYADIKDYMLYSPGGSQLDLVDGMNNIKANLYGGELEYSIWPSPYFKVSSSVTYTHGENRTCHRPLPQVPPLEANIAVKMLRDTFESTLSLRLVARQNRYSKGEGSIVGMDMGPSNGFGTVSFSCAYKPSERVQIAGGIDNLFNKHYSEFVSKTGQDDSLGVPEGVKVYEPGRNVWLKVGYQF